MNRGGLSINWQKHVLRRMRQRIWCTELDRKKVSQKWRHFGEFFMLLSFSLDEGWKVFWRHNHEYFHRHFWVKFEFPWNLNFHAKTWLISKLFWHKIQIQNLRRSQKMMNFCEDFWTVYHNFILISDMQIFEVLSCLI